MDGAAAAHRRIGLLFVRCLPDAAQPELLVGIRRHPHVHAQRADRHRDRAGNALHAARGLRLRFRRADHARRELRLAPALPALHRRLHVLPRRLYPRVPWHVLRLLQGAARGAVDPRRDPAAAHDHDRIHGLRAAVGPDELLGGESVVTWLWGGYAVGNPTLNRFYSLHYLLPFVIAGVVVLHIWALHVAGQNNPAGIEPKTEKDTVAFTPYATIKDTFLLAVFCILFAWFVFYMPNFLLHPDNYIPANPAVTPMHIVPEWYYLPFYAILRAIPNKLLGVIALAASILVLAFLPWLDTSKVRSARYRPAYRQFFWAFVIVCIGLGWLGAKPPEGNYVLFARSFTAYYFAFFLVILPVLGKIERTKPLPNSISESVLREGKPIGAPAPPPARA